MYIIKIFEICLIILRISAIRKYLQRHWQLSLFDIYISKSFLFQNGGLCAGFQTCISLAFIDHVNGGVAMMVWDIWEVITQV